MRTYLPALFIFLFFGNIGFAQDYLTLTGKVLDKKNQQPVSFAHVGIPEKGIGTTTGHDGWFQFKVPKQFERSTMIVSFMGYKTFKKSIHSYKNASTIHLERSTNELMEVVVMDQKAVEDIIRKAVRNIPNNYSTHPTTVLGFYRESRTDDSLRYRYLAEGVLNIHKNNYRSQKEGYVSLVQGRKINLKNPLDTIVRGGLSSGHMAAHRFDFVKNREDFIDETFFPVYKYWIESVTTYNDRPVYIIGFDKDKDTAGKRYKKNKWKSLAKRLSGKKNNSVKIESRMKGKLFIEQGSYAFIRAEFEILPEGLKKINDYPLYAGNWNGNNYVVNYRKVGNKWHFSDALREGENNDGSLYINEIKITEVNTEESEPIPYLERISRGQRFVKMTGTYNEDFWKNYNTTPLNAGLSESVQQYKNMQKAQEVFDPAYMAMLQQQRDSIKAEALKKDSIEMEIEVQKKKEEIARETGINIEDIDFVPEPIKRVNKVRKSFDKVKFMFGAGPHFLPTEENTLTLNYYDDDRETVLSYSNDLSQRNFEIILHWDFDIFFNKNFYMRFGNAFDFSNSMYKEWSIGAGTQFNLSKKRPMFFKSIAQYNYLRYARKLGHAENTYGEFKVKKKKFDANSIRLRYGSRLHHLKLSGELSIELNPSRELYFRGSYYWTFAHQENVWFKERKKLFPDKKRLPLKNERIEIWQNQHPFNDKIMPDESFSITVGLLFK